MPTPRLTALVVDETSGVDHPAHLREGWVVVKARTPSTRTQEDKVPDQDVAKADERIAALEAEMATLRKERDDAIAKAAELEAAATGQETQTEDEVLKSVPEPVRQMIEKARADAAEAVAKAAETTEELRKEREAAADRVAIEKAAAYKGLGLDAATFGPQLRQLEASAPELAKAVTTALDGALAVQEAEGVLTKSIGTSGGSADGGSAYSQLTALAKAAHEEGRAPTVEQAFVLVAGENPDLVNQHRAEKG